jgi:hypothetical protein
MAMLGVPYGDAVVRAEALAHSQAEQVARRIEQQGGPAGLADKQIVALVAYLERLGTDIKPKPKPAPGGELQALEPARPGSVHARAQPAPAAAVEVKP